MFGKKVSKMDVFVGTVKKCLDIKSYNKFGDTKPASRIRKNTNPSNVEVVYKDVILVRVNQFLYMQYEKGKSKQDFLGIPTKDGECFVDECTLKHYFTGNIKDKDKVSVRKLK